MVIRRKGVAIVDTLNGILVVAGRSKKYILPGGGAEKWESRKKAAIRELYEETDLKTKKIKYLFSYVGDRFHGHNGKSIRNHAKVFLVNTEGTPKPKHEIKYISFYKEGCGLHITGGTKKVIDKYLNEFKQ